MRTIPAILLTAGLVVSLAACAPANPLVASCESTGNAALVTATGAFEKDPKAEFPTPILVDETQVAVIDRGDGAAITTSDAVRSTLSLYDAETGDAIASQSGALLAVPYANFVTGIYPLNFAFACAPVGSRIAVTGTAEQLFGPEAIGLDPAMPLVVVADLIEAYPAKATGADQLPVSGFPAVVLAVNGQPGIVWPDGDAPSTLGVETLKRGSGESVADGDTIRVNLAAFVWGADATFASSWTQSQPVRLTITDLAADGSGVIPGLRTALTGATIGSQLVVVVPPSDGYPQGAAPAGVTDGDTLVFVIDVLDIE